MWRAGACGTSLDRIPFILNLSARLSVIHRAGTRFTRSVPIAEKGQRKEARANNIGSAPDKKSESRWIPFVPSSVSIHWGRRTLRGKNEGSQSFGPLVERNTAMANHSIGLALLNRGVNPLVRAVLRSPAHRLLSGFLLLFTFPGRRSRKAYTIPVQYARSGGLSTSSSGRRGASSGGEI